MGNRARIQQSGAAALGWEEIEEEVAARRGGRPDER